MALVTLKPFNTVALVANTATQLVGPPGHWYFNILNVGASNVAVSSANTVGLTDPGSFLLPPNLSLAPLEWGPTGIWVLAGVAENLSVALVPRQGS